jgi:tetratricopeptide (TPR) repeat protein
MKCRRLCLALCLLCVFPLLRAAQATRDLAVETKIEQQLHAIDPALVEPFRNARIAMDRDDYAESARLLAIVCERAPSFDAALRRRGNSLARVGQRREGLPLVEKAVALNRSSANLSTLASVLAFPGKETPPRSDQERAHGLLQECLRLPDGQDVSNLTMSAQLALQLQRTADARTVVALLEARHPDLMQTHYFAAVLAAVEERWIKAEDEIRQAAKLGLSAEAVNRFLNSGVQSKATTWRITRATGWTIGGWAGGLILLCGLGYVLSKATLRQIERSDPTVPISTGEHRLRSVYRTVINLAGVYYYISLPVVTLIVLLAFGAIFYGFLMMGFIPIKITLLLAIGAIATIWTMGRSLFLRVQQSDPGRPLTRAEAEGLWQVTDEVAQSLNTRPIDEIRVTPGTDLCVYERGTWREKLDNRAQRVLVLGVAVLNDFKQSDFRSVLAHEYGHFSNRDTAGGDIALRVQNDILKFYYTMVAAGQATWLNLAFHFLRVYHFIFRRITHGATRLQEVLADRVAAQTYGPVAFEGGLRHVIRQSLEFDSRANREIGDAIKSKRPLQNLYEPGAIAEEGKSIDEEFEKAINRPTTADDTHPGPKDRFRLIAPIKGSAAVPATGVVWDLFTAREAIIREMTETVEKNIAAHRE